MTLSPLPPAFRLDGPAVSVQHGRNHGPAGGAWTVGSGGLAMHWSATLASTSVGCRRPSRVTARPTSTDWPPTDGVESLAVHNLSWQFQQSL
jgi:hypothetical protein